MDRIQKIYAVLSATLAVSAISLSHAGTRFLPPPPPRYDGGQPIQTESYWGQEPTKPYANSEDREAVERVARPSRFSALEDDEGREVDFNSAGYRRGGRSPAGLQVQGEVLEAPARPVLHMGRAPESAAVSSSETRRQEEKAQRFVTDLADPVERRKGVQEVALIAGDLGFFPKTIFVSRDVPVRLFVTGASKQNLCLMMDTFNVRRQVRSSKIEEITFVPSQPGTYRFYCPINNGEGTLVVKELSTVAGIQE